jgi:hypothetical protein
MDDRVLKIEVYRSLIALKRQYDNLPRDNFPCEGANKLWSLLSYLIDMMIDRVESYYPTQLRLLNTLLTHFETYCGQLYNSTVDKVPWSILPSIENIFGRIKKDALFIITPQWEYNYGIYIQNVVDLLKSKVILSSNLIFEPDDKYDENVANLLNKYPNEIYILLYPRRERLSVLHFPLLGHEIGHIFAELWLSKYYEDKLKTHDVDNNIEAYIKKIKPTELVGSLFQKNYIHRMKYECSEVFHRVTREIISDFVGALIFGFPALLASYIYSVQCDFDDIRHIDKGYLPWRFRLYFISKILKEFNIRSLSNFNGDITAWLQNIEAIIDGYDYDKKLRTHDRYGYVVYLFLMLDSELSNIAKELMQLVPKPHYTDIENREMCEEVVRRLKKGILPNCSIDENLSEKPIGFRNIITGTWLYLCDQPLNKTIDFNKKSKNANLLSLKAIELSHLQRMVG